MTHQAQALPTAGQLLNVPERFAPANETVIAVLEDWLAMARNGEIVHLGLAAVLCCGSGLTAVSDGPRLLALQGSVTNLMLRLSKGQVNGD